MAGKTCEGNDLETLAGDFEAPPSNLYSPKTTAASASRARPRQLETFVTFDSPTRYSALEAADAWLADGSITLARASPVCEITLADVGRTEMCCSDCSCNSWRDSSSSIATSFID